MLGNTACAKPIPASLPETHLLFLKCHATFSSNSDFGSLSRLLNHPSNQMAVYSVGLDKLSVFLDEMSAKQHKQLTFLLHDDVDAGDEVILNSIFGESNNVDFSKNLVTENIFQQLIEIARSSGVEQFREKAFSGEHINFTEDRAVLHTALRNRSNKPVVVDGKDVMPEINKWTMEGLHWSKDHRCGQYCIGGSDLGPLMVTEALKAYQVGPNVHFVSNIDGTHLAEVLKKVSPATTLFIIASKTFTTQETITNAESAKACTNIPKVKAFGIDEANMFQFWDWVGGRYSLWSAIGAHLADNTSVKLNWKIISQLFGCIGVWYINFYGSETHAYCHTISTCTDLLPISSKEIWSLMENTSLETELLLSTRQGTRLIPCDFIAPVKTHNPINNGLHHQILFAHKVFEGNRPTTALFCLN
uniref:Glucose-6-phosphate isomerase n=1 Tax=Ditylenchus dipsaci TaxID=166011 RepID=A0A915DPJ8_9BILA